MRKGTVWTCGRWVPEGIQAEASSRQLAMWVWVLEKTPSTLWEGQWDQDYAPASVPQQPDLGLLPTSVPTAWAGTGPWKGPVVGGWWSPSEDVFPGMSQPPLQAGQAAVNAV